MGRAEIHRKITDLQSTNTDLWPRVSRVTINRLQDLFYEENDFYLEDIHYLIGLKAAEETLED